MLRSFQKIIISIFFLSCSPCPEGFILVPLNNDYVKHEFCVSKYEIKRNNGQIVSEAKGEPLINISRNEAIEICKSFGDKFDLINILEFQSIVRNIELVSTNWSTSIVGKGKINRGLSNAPSEESEASNDNNPCYKTKGKCSKNKWDLFKRTHLLSNGNIIWDIAGNAWDYIKDDYSSLNLEVNIPFGRFDFNNNKLFPTNGSNRNRYLMGPKNSLLNRSNGIGHIGSPDYKFMKGKSFNEVIVRGGHHDSGDKAGIFTILRTPVPPDHKDIGSARCVYHP